MRGLSEEELRKMKAAIGYPLSPLPRRSYLAYRNCYLSEGPDEDWEALARCGFARHRDTVETGEKNGQCYAVTPQGLLKLAEAINCRIMSLYCTA